VHIHIDGIKDAQKAADLRARLDGVLNALSPDEARAR
jgi:hypothetical protein